MVTNVDLNTVVPILVGVETRVGDENTHHKPTCKLRKGLVRRVPIIEC